MHLMVDPTREVLARLLADAPDGDVRALRAPDGRIYAWFSREARHVEVASALDLPFTTRAELQTASYRFNRRDVAALGTFTDFEDLVKRLAQNDSAEDPDTGPP